MKKVFSKLCIKFLVVNKVSVISQNLNFYYFSYLGSFLGCIDILTLHIQCVSPSHKFFAASSDLISGASLRCTYYILKLLSWSNLVPISFWNPSAIDSTINPSTSGCYLYYINHVLPVPKNVRLDETHCMYASLFDRYLYVYCLWNKSTLYPVRLWF